MENLMNELSAADAELLDLGSFLGENRTLRVIANRCSAAEAAGLRRLREERKYLRVAPDWQTFCDRFLGISKSQVDRIINLHLEFGDRYFDLAQLVRISPATYRALEPALQEIEIRPENCAEISRVVAELKDGLQPEAEPVPEIDDCLNRFDRQSALLFRELEKLLELTRSGPREIDVKARMNAIVDGLSRLELAPAASLDQFSITYRPLVPHHAARGTKQPASASYISMFSPRIFLLSALIWSVPVFAGSAPGIHNFDKVDAHVYRGAQPTTEGFQYLAKLGVHTIVDLREAGDRAQAEERVVTGAGMQYINVPMTGLTPPTDAEIVKLLAIMEDGTTGPVFVHCWRGADRTGAVIAAYHIDHDQWDNNRALRDAKAHAMAFFQFPRENFIRRFQPRTAVAADSVSATTTTSTVAPKE